MVIKNQIKTMDAITFNFLCNNVKGLETSKKRLKLFNYFKSKMFPNSILQETHSTKGNKIKWKYAFDGDLYFSHGKPNSCRVLIGSSGNKTFTVKKHL